MPNSAAVDSVTIPGASFGETPQKARNLDPGMGVAVARRTVFRPEDQEDWGNVADRVAHGNMSLAYAGGYGDKVEELRLRNAIASGALLTSGRHLQHGDENQVDRNLEVFSNCATAISSFAKFYLLLNGAGVGRSYDDDLMVVDWSKAPDILLYLSPEHVDHYVRSPERFAAEFNIQVGEISAFAAQELLTYLPDMPAGSVLHRVEDSREGWAKAVEIWESMAYTQDSQYPLVLDFSDVRPCGAPIHGMQDRPASGPLSVMRAFMNVRRDVVQKARQDGMPMWEQAMRFDHWLSVEVQVGGARRAARMSMKSWRDPDTLKFIRIKSDNGLWTSNNSISVDKTFWTAVRNNDPVAKKIFEEATRCAYDNGEPGFINVDKLEDNWNGFAHKRVVDYEGHTFGSKRYRVDAARALMAEMTVRASKMQFPSIVNPCAEISLSTTGGFCVISDSAPILAQPDAPDNDLWDARAEDTIRLASRFLIRTNTMDSFYNYETKRSNRIGVSLTGIHEYAWVRFGIGFLDMLDEYGKAKDFWAMIARLSNAAKDEANRYSDELGVNRPATVTTVKPSGSVSKLYGITEGAHLPARKRYIRWVQFRGNKLPDGTWALGSDPLLAEYEERGYLLKELVTFPGMTIVGFPTEPLIMRLGMADRIVTATGATPEQQYEYLRLLEKYWLGETQSNQISYTLKLFTDEHSLEDFRQVVLREQPTIRCCAILPSKPEGTAGYEYLPEQEVSAEEYQGIVDRINTHERGEAIDMVHLQCESGVCPI